MLGQDGARLLSHESPLCMELSENKHVWYQPLLLLGFKLISGGFSLDPEFLPCFCLFWFGDRPSLKSHLPQPSLGVYGGEGHVDEEGRRREDPSPCSWYQLKALISPKALTAITSGCFPKANKRSFCEFTLGQVCLSRWA